MRRTTGIVSGLLLGTVLLSLVCLPAYAAPAGARVVSTTKQSVSGAEVASQVLKNLDKVALGSDGATVTLDVDGSRRDIALDLGDLNPASGGGAGIGGIAIIAAIAAGIFKGATVLLRLLR